MNYLFADLLPGSLEMTVITDSAGNERYVRLRWRRDEMEIQFDTPVVESVDVTMALACAKLILMVYRRQHTDQKWAQLAVLRTALGQAGLRDMPKDKLERLFQRVTGVQLSAAVASDIDYFVAYLFHRQVTKKNGDEEA